MDKADERRRIEQLDMLRDREQRRVSPEKQEPLVPKKSGNEDYKRNAELIAAGQSITEVVASDPRLMDRVAWLDRPLTEKRQIYNEVCSRIQEQTGGTLIRGDIGDIGEQASYVIPRENETFAKISTKESRHANDFAYEIARVHIFDLQEKKFKSDEKYAASPEGLEVEKVLSASGNRGDVRNYLVTTQTAMIGGDAARAVEMGKLIKPPAPPKRPEKHQDENKTGIDWSPSKSTDAMRLEMINVLFGDPRITDKKKWDSMKSKPAEKRQLFSDLNKRLAEQQAREPLPAHFGHRKTALYGDGNQRVAVMNYKETEDRLRFIEAVGMLNLRQVQELNFETPEKYIGLITNAKIKGRMGDEYDMGQVNYREIQWNKQAQKVHGTDRIDIHTNETTLLGRDIVQAYGHLTSIETQRHDKHVRDLESQRRKAQADKT